MTVTKKDRSSILFESPDIPLKRMEAPRICATLGGRAMVCPPSPATRGISEKRKVCPGYPDFRSIFDKGEKMAVQRNLCLGMFYLLGSAFYILGINEEQIYRSARN